MPKLPNETTLKFDNVFNSFWFQNQSGTSTSSLGHFQSQHTKIMLLNREIENGEWGMGGGMGKSDQRLYSKSPFSIPVLVISINVRIY